LIKNRLYISILASIIAVLFVIRVSFGNNSNCLKIAPRPVANTPFALLEIFTSEGCSSCPPAYKVVNELVEKGKQKNENILLLDFHVDYFNSKSWTDPFSKREFTDRQKNYGKKFDKSGAYTPQMIVNGTYEGLASDHKLASNEIDKALKIQPVTAIRLLSVEKIGDSLHVKFSSTNIPANTVINFALVQRIATVKVLGGENAGKTLTHHNVVRVLKTIPFTTFGSRLSMDINALPSNQDFSVIAFIQDIDNQDVLAADEKDLTK
jgi:hypothetical protein